MWKSLEKRLFFRADLAGLGSIGLSTKMCNVRGKLCNVTPSLLELGSLKGRGEWEGAGPGGVPDP